MLSRILEMPVYKYIAFIERKTDGSSHQRGMNHVRRRLESYGNIVPENSRLTLEIGDERLLRQYPASDKGSDGIVRKIINTRNELSEHVVRGLLDYQRTFWKTGKESDIKPLTFRQFLTVFPHRSLDESRLSRLVSKLTLQNHGGNIVSLRNLFISKRKFFANIIKQLIDSSDCILSDMNVQTILFKEHGVDLSVRTICYCRKLLSIPNLKERHASYCPKDLSFSRCIYLFSKQRSRIPTEAGVYELSVSWKIPYSIGRSQAIYIGASKNLRRRAASYGGKVLKNECLATFLSVGKVYFRYHVSSSHVDLEKELLRGFRRHFGELPKGNVNGGKL